MKRAFFLLALLFSSSAFAQFLATEPALIQPQELAAILNSKQPKPLILNVGPRMLYAQAHIPGAEYIGQGSDESGRQALRNRMKNVPKKQFIVLYCGCCPWSHCPNVNPAYKELFDLGYRNVKVLYIATNLGADWVYHGYPTVRGQ
ncbi:MAG TPA: rhodanese-like domain-containing protein [Terriglobales bacterium]|nr:rhodanese-like domain-containing protein [Terriglobales bacterium]